MPQKNHNPNRTPDRLSDLFSRYRVAPYTPALRELWGRHFDGDRSASEDLFHHYAPLVRLVAQRLMQIRPELFRDMDVVLSDGAFGLWKAIDRNGVNERADGPAFFLIARRSIKKFIYRCAEENAFIKRRGMEHVSNIAKIRARLTAQLGRLPYRDELAAAVRQFLPVAAQIFVEGERGCHDDSSYASPTNPDAPGPVDSSAVESSPEWPVLDAETIRLAEAGMTAEDRGILRRVLDGHRPAEIARHLGISKDRIKRRINGVIWTCKSNAALCRYLGVEHQERPGRVRIVVAAPDIAIPRQHRTRQPGPQLPITASSGGARSRAVVSIDPETARLAESAMNPQQREIFSMMLQDLPLAEVARRLKMGERTARGHMTRIIWLCKTNQALASHLGNAASQKPKIVHGRLPFQRLDELRSALGRKAG